MTAPRKEIKSVADLLGETLISIDGVCAGSEEIRLILTDGRTFRLFHSQSCCENVSIEDVAGDPRDLVGQPLAKAEESSSGENPPGVTKEYQDSFTWTFYHFATVNGYVTIRWYGSSNGYYSERVDFAEVE